MARAEDAYKPPSKDGAPRFQKFENYPHLKDLSQRCQHFIQTWQKVDRVDHLVYRNKQALDVDWNHLESFMAYV